MKKYIIVMAGFLLTAGMVNAQTTKKTSTENPTAKVNKPTSTKKTTSSTATVTPATTSGEKKAGATTTTKTKPQHKKTKPVPASNK